MLILRMRLFILPNTKRHFWSMWRTNTVPNIDKGLSLNPTLSQAAISSSLQWLVDLVYLLLIHMICPAMMKKNLMSKSVGEMSPGQSDRAARLLIAARLYLNPAPETTKNWGQVDPNLNDYHSNRMEVSSTSWLPHITGWWHQQEETHWKYAELSNVACDIFSILAHSLRVEASFSLGRGTLRGRESKTTVETLQEKVGVRQIALANNGIVVGDYPALHTMLTESDLELKRGWRKENCTEWPRSTSFWRCGRAANNYLLHRRNLSPKQSKSQP